MMAASYLDAARRFASRNEENEVNELIPENPISSFTSYSPASVNRAKLASLASLVGNRGDAWRGAILAGIRYAGEGRVNPEVIQEDIALWKELAAHYDWPPAPPDLITNEENEFNEERRIA